MLSARTYSSTPDLAFAPVVTPAPKRLTQAQIAHYNAQGFITGLQAFSEDGASKNLDYFDTLLAQAGPDGGYAVNCFQARLKGVWDLCTNPVILDHVEDIIGPNIICWASHFFAKLPGDPKTVPWHQDAGFWSLSPARTVTVWLAIDATDEDNSAMRFLPATHDKGELAWRAAGDGNVLNKELVGTDAMGAPFSNNLNAGEFSMHADMLAHGSLPNRSDRRRCGLTIRYCPPEVTITDAQWKNGIEAIIARGEDPTGTWKHHDRPPSNVFEPKDGPRNVGGN
ncbi:MAG: phytanoyl-CoA dioxygenase family protein [Devosiaceae bacterium]